MKKISPSGGRFLCYEVLREMSHCDAIKIDIEKWDRKCVPIFFLLCNCIWWRNEKEAMREREMIFPCDWILMTFAIKSHSFIARGPRAHYKFSSFPRTNYLLNIKFLFSNGEKSTRSRPGGNAISGKNIPMNIMLTDRLSMFIFGEMTHVSWRLQAVNHRYKWSHLHNTIPGPSGAG